MKLLTLVLILLLVLLAAYMLCGSSLDFFTPSPYILSWQPPTDNGGDPGCCGYDWQICGDNACATIVDSGSTRATSIQTTKLDWATTYNVWVRATNVSGQGPWTKAVLSTGDGVVSSVAIGASLTPTGPPLPALSAGPGKNIAVWTSLSKGSVLPNTLKGSAKITITRSGVTQPAMLIPLESSVTGTVDVFDGDLSSSGVPLVTLLKGDVVTADVLIFTSGGEIVTEATSSVTITTMVPGSVTGLSLTYGALPPPLNLLNKYEMFIENLYAANPSPYKTVQDVAAAALVLYNEMPTPLTDRDYQTKMSLFFLSELKWVGAPGADHIFRGIGYFYVLLNSMGWDTPSICAAFELYRRVPADANLAKSFNNGSGIDSPASDSPTYSWGPGGINVQSYYTQVQNVLKSSSCTFSPGLSTSPGTTCPSMYNCTTCAQTGPAAQNTVICDTTTFQCSVTDDQIAYWQNLGKTCQCNC